MSFDSYHDSYCKSTGKITRVSILLLLCTTHKLSTPLVPAHAQRSVISARISIQAERYTLPRTAATTYTKTVSRPGLRPHLLVEVLPVVPWIWKEKKWNFILADHIGGERDECAMPPTGIASAGRSHFGDLGAPVSS